MILKLSDNQWQEIGRALPEKPFKRSVGRPPIDDRRCFEAILWLKSHGVPWKDLPQSFGSRSAINHRMSMWISTDVWPRMVAIFLAQLTKKERAFWLEVLQDSLLPKTEDRRRYDVTRGRRITNSQNKQHKSRHPFEMIKLTLKRDVKLI